MKKCKKVCTECFGDFEPKTERQMTCSRSCQEKRKKKQDIKNSREQNKTRREVDAILHDIDEKINREMSIWQ